jgi:hypothetical protein
MSDVKAIPTPDSLHRAANLDVYDQDGTKVDFGSLFESKRTIFVFIRTSTSCISVHLEHQLIYSQATLSAG